MKILPAAALAMLLVQSSTLYSKEPQYALPLCIGDMPGWNCVRGADAVFEGGQMVRVTGVNGCHIRPGADERMVQLLNQSGYQVEITGTNEYGLLTAKFFVEGRDVADILAQDALVSC